MLLPAVHWSGTGRRPPCPVGGELDTYYAAPFDATFLAELGARQLGAICPKRQTGAAIVMPRADTQGMQAGAALSVDAASRPRFPGQAPRREEPL